MHTTRDTLTVTATIERIFYNENGRIVARVYNDLSTPSVPKLENGTPIRSMSILGAMIDPIVGQQYALHGELGYNATYRSHELRFDSYVTVLPTKHDGILRYLIDTAKWVGPAVAKELVDAFGDDTLAVLKSDPDRVARAIPGVTHARALHIQETLTANERIEHATVQMATILGGTLPPATSRKAIAKWGCDAPDMIRDNPFLLTELHGVGFPSADAIHMKLGGNPMSMARAQAGLLHTLNTTSQRHGHTLLATDTLIEQSTYLLGTLRSGALEHCYNARVLRHSDSLIQTESLATAESFIAGKFRSMLSTQHETKHFNVITTGLAPDQLLAVKAFETGNPFALIGAPGTGKTYTIARIVKSALAAGLTVELAAPTGKAAKQMQMALADVCPRPASTIHSILGPTFDEDTETFAFTKCVTDPISADLLIIDEFSMVDVNLAHNLLLATQPTTKLLIVGDHYQLPSVGPGAVLRDLLDAGIPHYELTDIKRNAGTIVRACHAIKDGKPTSPCDKLDLDTGDNWRHLDTTCDDPTDEADATKQVIELLLREKIHAMGLDPLWDVQTISPTNESGQLSCKSLNTCIKQVLNPIPPAHGMRLAIGDKVVRTKNGTAKSATQTYTKKGEDQIRIVNGDIGIIDDIDKSDIVVTFKYPDRQVILQKTSAFLKLAYCLTCHKMQGSEIPVIILPLTPSFNSMPMVTREWIYTAISRAKLFLVTIGDLSVINTVARKAGNRTRNTNLRNLMTGNTQ